MGIQGLNIREKDDRWGRECQLFALARLIRRFLVRFDFNHSTDNSFVKRSVY